MPTHVPDQDPVPLLEDLGPESVAPSTPAGPRIAAAIVALILTLASFALATDLFGRVGLQPAATVRNGKIAFQAFDGSTWQIFAAEPDGTSLVQLTHVDEPELAADPAWSPDGSRLAYVVQGHDPPGTGPANIWVMRADGTDARPLTDGPGWRWNPAWSPDGARIAFIHHYDIHVMDADGTNVTNLMPQLAGPGAFEPTWSPDGESIAFVGREADDDLYIMRSDGGDVRTLFSDQGYQREIAWSPDSSKILFANVTEQSGSDVGEFSVIDPRGNRLIRLSNLPRNAQAPTWSPDGSKIAFMANVPDSDREALYVMNADGTGVHEIPGLPMNASWPAWQPVPVDEEPLPSTPPDVLTSSPKANGAIYFSIDDGDGPRWFEAVEPDGSDRRVVFENQAMHMVQIAWAPDGSRIAYRDPIAGHRGIHVANADGSNAVQLTDGENDGWPSWSPDGTKITFSSTRYDPSIRYCDRDQAGQEFLCPTDVYVMESNGSNVARLTTDDAAEFHPVWSPVGDRIAFVRPEQETGNEYLGIFTMDANGRDVRRVSSSEGGSDFSPTWAADGSQIAFVGFRWEDWGLWLVNADGTAEHEILFEGEIHAWFDNRLAWSPDGTSIAAICDPAGDGYAVALCLVRPDGSGVTTIDEVPFDAGGIAWQPAPTSDAPVDSSPTPDPAATEPTAVDVHVSTTTGIAPFPSGVAAGEGGVWVGAGRNDGSGAGDVVRLDPTSGDIVARIPVRSLPGWVVGGAGITVGLESVWVVGGTPDGDDCCSALVSRIDPSTNAVIDEIAIPDVLFGADVWVDETGLYVLSFHEDEPALDLASLDPETHEVRWRISLPAQWSQTVFVSGGSVWVLGTAPEARGPVEVNTLYRLDLADGRILAEIPLRNTMYAPAVAPDVLWLRTLEGAQRFDPLTAQPIGDPVQPAPGCCTGAFVADGAGGVWVISSPGVDTERGVWHIDASGRIVEVGAVADRDLFQHMLGQGYAFDPVTKTIWVQHYEESVSRVGLVSD